MSDYPAILTPVDHIEPAPRRVRGFCGGRPVFDTTEAIYVWEHPPYPHYYIPIADVDRELLVDEHTERLRRGPATRYGLRCGPVTRPGVAHVHGPDAMAGLAGMVRFDWDALDAWFEEDEQIFVHPRNPYTRVDAVRSTRPVRVELEGAVLAESSAPVMVFETGLPTRYYVNRTDIDLGLLSSSDTVTACPYKGATTAYWSAVVDGTVHADIAWCYDFPTAALLPIAGLVAFYNEMVDLTLDGAPLPRPVTAFSR